MGLLVGIGEIMGEKIGRELCINAIECAPPAETWRTGIGPSSRRVGTDSGFMSVSPRRPWLQVKEIQTDELEVSKGSCD
jgi:hypothetical protein